MNERIATFAESLFIFWQYPFLLYIMGMSGHKNLILFLNTTHQATRPKTADYTIQSEESIFTTGSNWHFTEKWVMTTTFSLFTNPFTFCNAIPLDTTHCAMCTKLCLCGGGYGCTNSIWSEKKEDSAYLALGSSSS